MPRELNANDDIPDDDGPGTGRTMDHDNDGVDLQDDSGAGDQQRQQIQDGGAADDAGGEGAGAAAAAQMALEQELLQQAQQFGVQGYQDPRALVRDLWTAARERNELRQQVAQIRQQHAVALAAQQQAAMQAPAAAAPAAQAKKFWDPPQISPTLIRTYQVADANSPTGWKFRDDTPPDLIAKYNAREAYIAEWAGKLSTDPESALAPMFDQFFQDRVQKAINEAFQQNIAPVQEGMQIQGIIQRNLQDLAQVDQYGMPMMHPNGAPVLSPFGQLVTQFVGELARKGVRDYNDQFAMAKQMANAHILMQQHMATQQQVGAADQQARGAVHAATQRNGGQRQITRRRPPAGGGGEVRADKKASLYEKMVVASNGD